MNGGQDLGGIMGLGPVVPEPNEPVFHADWEKRVLAVTLAAGATGAWNIDKSRFARENRHPAEYMSLSYYEIWLAGMERLVVDNGLVTAEELKLGRSLEPAKPVKRVLAAADVPAVLARGGPCDRPATAPARFKAGDSVRAKNMHPTGHTRIPRYVRGRPGRIEQVHGAYVFPDTNAAGRGEQPAWLYSVAFYGRDLWGDDGDPATMPVAPPGIDEQVFGEPWQAEAFALAVELHARGAFTWTEWAATLSAEIAAAKPDDAIDASLDAGARYYRHWLAALEKLVVAKQLTAAADLSARRDAWDRAARATPHGEPIVLGRETRADAYRPDEHRDHGHHHDHHHAEHPADGGHRHG